MGKTSKKRKRKSWIRRRLELFVTVATLIGVIVAGNWIYQVWKKPTELIGVFDSNFHKTPKETWVSYGQVFRAKSTNVITPTFIAALAQVESNGNPVVRTYWKLNLTSDPSKIFAPASTAVGMFQITRGTFKEAKEFCLRGGRAVRDRKECQSEEYTRVIPAHAVEMIAARLHWYTDKLIRKYNLKRAGLREKQNLATVIHLCGLGKAEQLARSGLHLSRLGRCGDHNALAYVKRVQNVQREFATLAQRSSYLAQGD